MAAAKRGGRRLGAGRPGSANGARKRQLRITLSEKEQETLKRAAGHEPLTTWARRILLESAAKKKARG